MQTEDKKLFFCSKRALNYTWVTQTWPNLKNPYDQNAWKSVRVYQKSALSLSGTCTAGTPFQKRSWPVALFCLLLATPPAISWRFLRLALARPPFPEFVSVLEFLQHIRLDKVKKCSDKKRATKIRLRATRILHFDILCLGLVQFQDGEIVRVEFSSL